MPILPRRIKPPTELRKSLTGDERFLAIADSGATTVAATQLGLWLPVADPPGQGWRRVDWDQVVKATWTGRGLELIEGDVDPQGIVTDRAPRLIAPTEPRNLPAVVRARVERSIGRWEQVRVPGGTGRIVGRRKFAVNGLSWTARLDTGTPDTAQARAVLVDYLDRIAAMTPEELVQS